MYTKSLHGETIYDNKLLGLFGFMESWNHKAHRPCIHEYS